MTIDPAHLHQCVVRPTLEALAVPEPRIWSWDAEMLLMGTAAVESRLGELLRQQYEGRPAGVARGVWQMEPSTADDVLNRYLRQYAKRGLRRVVERWLPRDRFDVPITNVETGELDLALMADLRLNCALARIRYWMSPDPLPSASAVVEQGVYWAEKYQRGGADPAQYARAWEWHLAGWAYQMGQGATA